MKWSMIEIISRSMSVVFLHSRMSSHVGKSLRIAKCYWMFIELYYATYCTFFFTDRIHGSVDCLSELSSSRLSHPFSGESSAVITSFDWDLFEICVCIYYATVLFARICMGVLDSCNCHAGTIRRSFSTSSAIATPKETSRRSPITRCASLLRIAVTFHPPQAFQLHPNALQQRQNQY